MGLFDRHPLEISVAFAVVVARSVVLYLLCTRPTIRVSVFKPLQFLRPLLSRRCWSGYHEIVHLPVGALNIHVKELAIHHNYLGKDSQYDTVRYSR